MRIAVLDIGGTSIKSGLVEGGVLTGSEEQPTHALEGGEAVLLRAESILQRFGSFQRIGVSTAGQVDSINGVIRFANENIPNYTGMRVKERLESRFHVPVAVENDVNAAALGEAFFGAGRDCRDFLCLTYGTGIGGAVVIDRKIYSGSSFSAGEFGHMVTHGGGKPCACGNGGCYEQYASVTALVRNAKLLDPLLDSGRAVFQRLAEPAVQSLVDAWVQEIVYGLVSLIHIFNPSRVILGGGVMSQPELIRRVDGLLRKQIMSSYQKLELRAAQMGNTAGLMGAFHLADLL